MRVSRLARGLIPMNRQIISGIAALSLVVGCVFSLLAQPAGGDDLAGLQEQAMKAAVAKIAPSIVQIETSGGSDLIGAASGPLGGRIRKGVGPTTGLVVGADGYVISSAFNFANKPSAIFVAIPGQKERYPAKAVATDETRMLTLLKIEATGLPVPTAVPRKEIKVGQSALALGRTWSGPEQLPSVSAGIISALDRIWGKALQTDAKVSPVNYGGPLVDIQGRVLGVLIPASPQGEDETAGIEWYDSGIGFAIPLEDVDAVLPRLKEGKNLKRGLLGVSWPPELDRYGPLPPIATVIPKSAADAAGIQPGDVITEIGGAKIVRHTQLMHALGSRYEGDVLTVKVKRGTEEKPFKDLKLTGALAAYARPFIGILPLRDDPEPGVQVRYVFPKSPAEAAGIKVGDRVLSIGTGKTPKQFSGRDDLVTMLGSFLPGSEVKLEVRRPEVKDLITVTLRLNEVPDMIPDEVPEPATIKKALEPRKMQPPKLPMPPMAPMEPKKDPKKKPETGLLKRSNTAGDHEYWVFVPSNYDPNIAYALIVWLHPPGKGKDKDAEAMRDIWEGLCEDHHLIWVSPKAENESGWLASEADFVHEAIRSVIAEYTIDQQRIIAHGIDSGGQMAFRLGLTGQDLIRGVAVAGAALPGQVSDTPSNQRLAFFIVNGEKDPVSPLIAESKDKLLARKYPVAYRVIPNMGRQYLDAPTIKELVRWIDALDRL
jgi:S1-C subfamily serine protease/predicted esterase